MEEIIVLPTSSRDNLELEVRLRDLYLAVAVFVVGLSSWASAQESTVNRAAQGQAGKDIRVGVYANVQSDCTSGPLPSIRLSTAPAHGKVTVKKAKINATNFKQCLAVEVPAFVALYKSQPDFSGDDVFVLEVKFPNGKTVVQRITVTVAAVTPSGRV
jgi:hypothetical protein